MDQGKRMFYADPTTGETIPDSDDENEKVCSGSLVIISSRGIGDVL